MAITVDQVWRRIKLEAPLVPTLLIQSWVQETFAAAWGYRLWSFSRVEGALQTSDQHTGTVTVARGSNVVTLDGTMTGSAADLGRQIKVLDQLPINIVGYTAGSPSTLRLETTYTGASGTQNAAILDAWLTMPADFQNFECVWDPSNNFDLWFWATELDLNRLDPGRDSTGTPYVLASRSVVPSVTAGVGEVVQSGAGQLRYEIWPPPTDARSYPMLYKKSPPVLQLSDSLIEPFGSRMDWIYALLMAKVCRWPGTEQRRNPHYSFTAAEDHEKRGQLYLAQTELTDEDRYPTWYLTRQPRYGYPLDSRFLQSHDYSARFR